MSFYKSISKYYSHIFPYNALQNDFILKNLDDAKNSYLLDIGCAIGELANNLSFKVKKIDAIDLDAEMLLLAEKSKQNNNISFSNTNMLELEDSYTENTLDAISCFGNTLVHLNSEEEINSFINTSYKILKKEANIFIQIINYDRILDEKIDSLPKIENEDIEFIRKYIHTKNNKISFETILNIKKEKKKLENAIDLLPLRKESINKMLVDAGFLNIEYYSNFKGETFHSKSIPLIIIAKK